MIASRQWRTGLVAFAAAGSMLLLSCFALLLVRGNSENLADRVSRLEREAIKREDDLRKIELRTKEATHPVELMSRVEGRMAPADRNQVVRMRTPVEGGTF